ncbi:MAG: hypothetical protein AAB365_01820 [Patescibacteria group bacterium]
MTVSKDRLIDRIETRLQFTITILVLFLALSINQNISLSGCIIVVAYVVDYIFFAILGDKLSERALKFTNTWVVIGIASYIIPLTLAALSTQNNTLSGWQVYFWGGSTIVSFILMLSVPLIVLASIIITGINWKK